MRSRFIVTLLMSMAIFALLIGCQQEQEEEHENNRVQISAEQKKLLQDMNKAAEFVFQYLQEDKLEQARNELQTLGHLVSQLQFAGLTEVEGIEALTQAIVAGKETLSAVQYDHNKSLYAVIQIRLAVDALKKSRNAMWLQYGKVISDDVRKMRNAIDANDRETVIKSFEQTKLHLSLIRPSLLIRRAPSQVEAVDSLMIAMEQRLHDEQTLEPFRALVEHYATLMSEMFHEEAEDTFITVEDVKARPLLWSTIIGSLIVSVLSYVAYRRYRYERDHFVVIDQKKKTDER